MSSDVGAPLFMCSPFLQQNLSARIVRRAPIRAPSSGPITAAMTTATVSSEHSSGQLWSRHVSVVSVGHPSRTEREREEGREGGRKCGRNHLIHIRTCSLHFARAI